LGIFGDHAIEIVTVNHIEFERCQRFADVFHLARTKWNEIRIAPHEREQFSVSSEGEDIASANDASPSGTAAPLHYPSAGEVPATAQHSASVAELARLTLPPRHGPTFAHNPILVGGIEMDRTIKGLRPLIHRRIEMRVRNRDCFQAAETFNHANGRRIERGDTVPQYV